jgi:hypothetical protein
MFIVIDRKCAYYNLKLQCMKDGFNNSFSMAGLGVRFDVWVSWLFFFYEKMTSVIIQLVVPRIQP